MATSSSALTVAFSSALPFSSSSSSVSSKPSALSFPRVRFPRAASTPRLNAIYSSFSSLTTVGAVAGSASVSEEEVEGVSLEKYVNSRLPGGFAAQRIIGTGRRKCAIARVVLQEGTGKFFINYRDAQEYLQGNPLWLQYIKTPLLALGYENSCDVFVKAHGGGLSVQALAISLGIARALLKVSENHRAPLRKEGLS